MFERALACGLAVIMLALGSPLAAQSEEFAERERALARELAEQQDASARELAEQQDAAEREQELARELAAQQRAVAAQQAEQERALAREFQARQRELAAQQREVAAQQAEQQRTLAREFESQQRELARELSKAKEQLSVSAVEIARLSAQLSGGAMSEVQNLRFLGQGAVRGTNGAVLGINIEDAELGARVRAVTPGGPAAAAGVAVGDTVVAIDDFELGRGANPRIDSPTAAFLGQLADVEAGEDVELRILRDGDERDVVVKPVNARPPFRFTTVAPGSRRVTLSPNAPESIILMSRGPWSDVELVSLTPALGEYFGTDMGLLVVRAGRMGDLGLRDGDVILELGGRQPQSPEHAMRIVASFEPGESLQASIMRQRRRENLTITVPTEPAGWGTGD